MIVREREREREREAETQAEGEAGSMHQEPDVGFDPGSPGSRPGPKAGAKPLRHPRIPHKSLPNETPLCSLVGSTGVSTRFIKSTGPLEEVVILASPLFLVVLFSDST